MSNKSGSSSQAVTLPRGGGALQGIGETFTPDPFMGTGQTSVPIQLPPGRHGHQPSLSLSYSTGNGSGPFGLGWMLSTPSISRKTSKGVPRYRDAAEDPADRDTFLLAGAEDLLPVTEASSGVTRYQPRTEGTFARIERSRAATRDTWRVAGRDGLVSLFGAALPKAGEPAVVADPSAPARIFAWKLTETVDPYGNRIEYRYRRDRGSEGGRAWDQLYLDTIRYVDYRDGNETRFLVSVAFVYEDRPDPFSDYRAGFEIRTRLRCTRIETRTHADEDRLVRTYDLVYLDERVRRGELSGSSLPPNGLSLLSQVRVVGHDGSATEAMPPLEFGYTDFAPERRTFRLIEAVDGAMPTQSLGDAGLEMVGLFGNGLPDIVQLDGAPRFWRNLGGGQFGSAEALAEIPAGVRLRDPGVQLADMNGDGRADLLVLDREGYFPQSFLGRWSAQDFVRYTDSPAVTFNDAELRLIDLDGDGVVDALRTGVDLELFLNDPKQGWGLPALVSRTAIDRFPDVGFSDPRVKLADINGDNLQDLVFVEQGRIDYWPYLGHGRWGSRVTMADSPMFQDFVPLPGGGFDPQRVLLGDLDGDGLDDLAYIEPGRLTFWINRAGQGWSRPLVIDGTPSFPEADAVRLSDVLGTGFQGVLWTADQLGADSQYRFLELTGGIKPYVLDRIDNHLGKVIRIGYTSSTEFYRADLPDPRTRWKAPLPFPIQVVKRTEAIDLIAGGKLTTEYRYHHGYWDGVERELRGFGLVDQLDTETFADFHAAGLHGETPFQPVAQERFSPPTLLRTWFHLGDTGDDANARGEIDYTDEYWPVDPPVLPRPAETAALLAGLPGSARGGALRALRGSKLRTELFALDGSDGEDRPFTVTECQYGVREEAPPASGSTRTRIFFPHLAAGRTTQWERGEDPMTTASFTDDHDAFGLPRRTVSLAVPRRRNYRVAAPPGTPYLGTLTTIRRAQRNDPERLMVDRPAATTTFEIVNDGSEPLLELYRKVVDGTTGRAIIGQAINYYDGDAFLGLPFGQLGDFGALVRTESLVLTDDLLRLACQDPGDPGGRPRPPYLRPDAAPDWTEEYPAAFRDAMPTLAGYTFADGSDHRARGFFAHGTRAAFDFHDAALPPRGLSVITRDPLGSDTVTVHDRPFHALPVRVTDPAGLAVEMEHDYRVLQPRLLTDANGNRRAITFSPLGLVSAGLAMGNEGEKAGDTPNAPSRRLHYDFLAFLERQEPASVRSVVRQHHAMDTHVPLPQRDETIETAEFSDGFGRLLQTRVQDEDVRFGDAIFGGALLPDDASTAAAVVGRVRSDGGPVNVIVTGWQRYDNKGQVIEKLEPFLSTGLRFAEPGPAQRGRKISLFYDSRGRLLRTLSADGSEQRTVFGVPNDLARPADSDPSPWETYTYDANDLAASSRAPDGTSLAGAAPDSHHFTPSSVEVDALGRTVEAIVRNGATPADLVRTRTIYDIRGNVLSITDALDRVAFRSTYDLANRPWRVESIDAGLRRTVLNALGEAIEERDARGGVVLHAYDRLRRPVRHWARDDGAGSVTLRQRLEYGDAGASDQPGTLRAAMRVRNLLGQLHRHHDEAGLTIVEAVDFKGNALDRTRRMIADAAILEVFKDGPLDGWKIAPFQIDWEPGPAATLADREARMLETRAYRTTTTVDALGRIRTVRLPEDVEGRRHELSATFNNGGGLEQVSLDGTVFVERIAYDPKGQRALIAYGNGVMTRYAYDPLSCRLKRLRSERYTKPDALSYRPTGEPLQDLAYAYDLAGNIMAITDRTAGSGVPNNPDSLTEPDAALARLLAEGDALIRRFEYDPLYRLRSATGRECDRPATAPPWNDGPRCTDRTRSHACAERYRYDAMGNLLRLDHRDGAAGFTREFTVESGSNRLRRVETGTDRHDYAFDPNGNLHAESTTRHFEWSFGDQLRTFRTQTEGAEPSVHAHYLHDAAGQRMKKLVRTQGGAVEATHYIDGMFEHHRWSGAQPGENNHVHVMDDTQRIAMARVGAAHPDDRGPVVAFQLGDHLGNSHVVINGDGAIVNREEFTPFGETSFGSFARKRFRFSGRERDEESGLAYHGARYYAPGLARWVSCDPAGSAGGLNLFAYALNNPLGLTDHSGLQPEAPSEEPLFVGHETIEVTGTKPEDAADVQGRLGNTNVLTRDEFASGLGWQDLREDPNAVARATEYWKNRPDWQEAWENRVTAEYSEYRTDKNIQVHDSFRRNDAANAVGQAIGWLTVGAITVFGGGELLVAASNSAPAASLAQGATSLVHGAMASAPTMAVATVGYGVAAPPGAPDLPTGLDDLGRWGRAMLSRAVRDLDGAQVLVTRPDVQAHAARLIQYLQDNGLATPLLNSMARPDTVQYTRRAVTRALIDAHQLLQSGKLPGEVQPAFDWLMHNFSALQVRTRTPR